MRIAGVRYLLVVGLVAIGAAPGGPAMPPSRTISTAGASLRVPAEWDAAVARTPTCDPERLIVVSSAPLRIGVGGRITPPGNGQVVILLLEDLYRQDRPVGDLRRPPHFSITWNRLVGLKAICGNPNAPAFMRYFKTHGRYLGFIVYPGPQVGAQTRSKTLAVLDSLRVGT